MPKAIIIADIKHKQPGQAQQLRDLLRYLQYRDGSVRRGSYLRGQGYGDRTVSDAVKPAHRETRWVDRGMGETHSQIAANAQALRGRKVLARTWVLSPDPELMQHIPEDWRLEVMNRVTEQTVELWYGDNGWGQPEYSYVIHDKSRIQDEMQMLHAHVITPGTIPVDAAGALGRMDHFVRRPHLADLQRTSAQVFALEMERVLGRERAREVIRERNERLARQRRSGSDLNKAARVHDVLALLRRERERKQQARDHQDRVRRGKMRLEELRIYARCVHEESRKRREEDAHRRRVALAQVRAEALDEARDAHEEQVERIRQRLSRAELAAQEVREWEALLQYYAQMDAFHQQVERRREGVALERDLDYA